MHISSMVNSTNIPTQPVESPITGVAANIQHIESTGETLLSQQAPVGQHQKNSLSSQDKKTWQSQLEEQTKNLAKKWGSQDINSVIEVALRLDCYSLEGLTELHDIPLEDIYLHRSAHPNSLDLDNKTITNQMQGDELYPEGGTFFLISLKKQVTNPYSERNHITLACKLSDVLQSGGRVTRDINGVDCRSVVVILPKNVTISFESNSTAINNMKTNNNTQQNATITELAKKWGCDNIETVESIVKALRFYDASILSRPIDIETENVYLHCSIKPDQINLENKRISNVTHPSKYYPNGGIEFMVALTKSEKNPRTKPDNIELICRLSDILKFKGKITSNIFGPDRRSIIVELPQNVSIPFELLKIEK